MPPPTLQVALRDLFGRIGPWSRRQLRRMKGAVEGGTGLLSLDDRVTIDGAWSRYRFRGVHLEARAVLPPLILLDKPVGVVTSRVQEGGASTVFEVLDDPAIDRVQPVGRLDRESSGLLLLTADGRLIQRLTHPRREVPRSYQATVEGAPDPLTLEALRRGEFELRDGHRPRPQQLDPADDGSWQVSLVEGKYHEVRRIFGAAGARVTALRRTRFWEFTLDDLQGRRHRRLDHTETIGVYTRLGLDVPPAEMEVREVLRGASEG